MGDSDTPTPRAESPESIPAESDEEMETAEVSLMESDAEDDEISILSNEEIAREEDPKVLADEATADKVQEWVDVEVIDEEMQPTTLSFKILEEMGMEGLRKAWKSKDYRSEVLFAALADLYGWSGRQGRMKASLGVARNHRRGPAFAKIIRM